MLDEKRSGTSGVGKVCFEEFSGVALVAFVGHPSRDVFDTTMVRKIGTIVLLAISGRKGDFE